MNFKNNITNGEVPLGLGMALAENINAMNAFATLSATKQQEIINKAHNAASKKEMQDIVAAITPVKTL